MSLISQAKKELDRVIPDDPDLVQCYIEVVASFAAKSDERLDPDILATLFKGYHLGEITSDPDEWVVTGGGLWSNIRDERYISDDGGRTHIFISDTEEPVRAVSAPPYNTRVVPHGDRKES